MTITVNDARDDLTGNGSITIFPYTFRILDEDNILVQIITNSTGAVVTKAIVTDYTVSGVSDASGGNVTFVTAPAAGETIVLTRNVPLSQEIDLRPNDPFPSETVEATFDKIVNMVQQHSETLQRCVRAPTHKLILDSELATGFSPLDILRVNLAGDGFEAVDSAVAIDVDVLGDLTLTVGEITQLQNIDITTISTTQWGFLGGMDQNVLTTSNVTFNNITVTGTVDGRDIATDGTKLDGIEALADVTDEANVTAAIDGATLTAVTVATGDKVLIQDLSDSDNLKTVTTQSIADLASNPFDQNLNTTDSPTFVDATIGGNSFDQLHEHTVTNLASGVITGGIITVNGGDAAKFDVTAGHGIIVDYYTDPRNPTITEVNWTAFTAVTVTDIATTEFTELAISSGGAILQQSDVAWSETAKRAFMDIGRVSHVDNTTINSATSRGRLAFANATLLTDLVSSIGAMNSTGNIYSANPAGDLTIDKSTGTSFCEAVSYDITNRDPHSSTDASQIAPTLFTFYQDGSGGRTLVSLSGIDPDQYDDGSGTLAAVANNKWTIQRVYLAPASAVTGVEYGQNVYNSEADAMANIFTETHSRLIATTSLHRGFIVVKKGTTDLTNTANASFIVAPNIQGAIGGSGAGTVAAATMQSSYDNSPVTERILDDTKTDPAVTTRDASTPVSGNLYEWEDFAGTTNYESLSTTTKTYGVNVNHGAFYTDLAEISLPSNPAANSGRIYTRDVASVTTPFFLDSAGTETSMLGGGAQDHVITTGTNAPVSTPANIGDHYVDTNNNTHWFAHGTSASSDWRQVVQESDFGASLGFMVKKTDSFPATYEQRSFSNDDGGITITNQDGIAGAPVWNLSFQNITTISGDVDEAADWLAIRDDSASAMRKVHPNAIGARQLISTASASSSTSIDFTSLSTKFRDFIVVISSLVPATDAARLLIRTSTDNGSTYDSGASDYTWTEHVVISDGTHTTLSGATDSEIRLGTNIGSASGEHLSGNVTIQNPQGTGTYTSIFLNGTKINANGDMGLGNAAGFRASTGDVDAITFFMNTGNIASGEFTLYGVLK